MPSSGMSDIEFFGNGVTVLELQSFFLQNNWFSVTHFAIGLNKDAVRTSSLTINCIKLCVIMVTFKANYFFHLLKTSKANGLTLYYIAYTWNICVWGGVIVM